MANAFYPLFKERLLSGLVDLTTSDVKAAFLDNSYTFSSAHDFFDDIIGQVGSSSPALTSKTVTSGTFDAADTTVTSVTGNEIVQLVIYIDTGTASTSLLIGLIDGLSLTPNGNNIDITWHASGIFIL